MRCSFLPVRSRQAKARIVTAGDVGTGIQVPSEIPYATLDRANRTKKKPNALWVGHCVGA